MWKRFRMNCRILCFRDHVKLYVKTNSLAYFISRGFMHSHGKHVCLWTYFYSTQMCCWSLSGLGLWRHVYQNLHSVWFSRFIVQAVFPDLFLKVLQVCLSHLSQVSHPPGAPAAAKMGDTTQSPAGDPITLDTYTQSPLEQPVSSDTYRSGQTDNSVSWRRPYSTWMNVSM